MSFKPFALALAEALIEDIDPFAPFSMARIVEYAKVSGYAPDYQELKVDIVAFIHLCEAMELEAGGDAIVSLPNLTPNRLINEDFFLREKTNLIRALQAAFAALRAAPEAALQRRFAGLDADQRRLFAHLLERSGLDAKAMDAAPVPPTLEPGRDKVYVSSRYSERLQEQIAKVLAECGLDMVAPPSQNAGVDLGRVERDLRICVGGVFGLLSPGDAGSPMNASERALAPGLAELAMAERQLGRKLMILAQERIVPQLPSRLQTKPIFKFRHREMDELELSQFKSVAARTPWLLQETRPS